MLTDDPKQQQCWDEALATLDAQVIRELSDALPDAPIDVVVTDRPFDLAAIPQLNHPMSHGEVAVVAIAAPVHADVVLASDWTPRELQIACRLLGEIVRLRRDRKEGVQAQHALRRQALTDPLTGLANRRGWEEQLAQSLLKAQTEVRSLCLALFDVDHFKRINDEHGHLVGDAVLRAIGSKLAGAVRPDDLVARLGGDEFGLLVLDVTRQDAASLVERVQRVLRQDPTAECPQEVTISAGWVFHSPQDAPTTPQALYQAADDALRQAKAAGRNRTHFLGDPLSE